jgi:hypothetical protein
MARPTGLILAGQTHHIVQRANNRQEVFFSEDDRQFFLKRLGEALEAEGCALHAYVLMTNHFHLVITAGGGGVDPASHAVAWTALCLACQPGVRPHGDTVGGVIQIDHPRQ